MKTVSSTSLLLLMVMAGLANPLWARVPAVSPIPSNGDMLQYGWRLDGSLAFSRYRPPDYLETSNAEFMKKSVLAESYKEGLTRRWVRAGSERVFEEEERSLEDFSEIDIPIKFPSTIGKVIGQGANLNVSGSEQISFGGQTRYRVNEPLTEFGKRSKFPQLDMKQHLKIDLKGTVGEKIHVTVHHDSDIETPLENRIKLRYEGNDDEIVQSIEMGNTNLSIPGSQFVSYSGQQTGLFGAKLLAKFGPIDITAIASKQEGRTAAATFEGAATRDTVRLDDFDYVKNKYFFMMDPYELTDGAQFSDVVVYLDDDLVDNNDNAVRGYAFFEPDPDTLPNPAVWDSLRYAFMGRFDLLEPNRDYAVDLVSGEISLLRSLANNHTLAVSYIYGNGTVADTVGGVVQDSLMLKMIRPSKEKVIGDAKFWEKALKYERKNVYSLRATYISEEQVEVKIYKKEGGTGGSELQGQFEYAKILGIDLRDENGDKANSGNGWRTDGYADGGKVNGELGLLIFPDLRPFAPDIIPSDRPAQLEEHNPRIYDVHHDNLEPEDTKYFIVVKYSTPQTTFKLPNINILEGSEVVTLNGTRLQRNLDYEIYYDIGQIRFKTEDAADPDARILVDYQFVPFLSLAQQSLVGLQGIYRISERSHIGTAWLYQSKKSPEERPRLGQEPSQIVMGDVNANLVFQPDILTTLVDALPMVEAEAPSNLSLSGEIGMSFPNPNTKGSVYIDDMEGVRDLRSFPMTRRDYWVPSSTPPGLRWQDTRRMLWYMRDKDAKEEDLFTGGESRTSDAYIPVLEIDFKGFRYDPASTTPDPSAQWAGLQRLVAKTGSDYSDLKFIEVWLRQKGPGADTLSPTGVLHIDLGAVSENFYRPWQPDSLHEEDKDNDGKLSEDEDTGLDGIPKGAEGDDPNDDYFYNGTSFDRINGTEGNDGTVPDTEDLDDDGNLDTDEIHFRLSLDLADTSHVVNVASRGWRHYRIPLLEAEALGGTPSWKSIKYIRFFFTEFDSEAVYQIAYLQVAGASWLDEGIRDKQTMIAEGIDSSEVFEISAKNTQDDPDYVPPYDPGKDPEGFRKREQSLVFSVKSLGAGHSGSVYKNLAGNAQDFTLYQSLAFYVHGDDRAESEHLYTFVRIGADSINFYEYGTRVKQGWRNVAIPLEEITGLKGDEAVKDSIYGREVDLRYLARDDGWTAVYGNPSVTRVSRVSIGVVNMRPDSLPTGSRAIEVWVDDLRLTDVRKELGIAKRLSIGASFSDVLNVNADFKQTDTEFQTLGSNRRGSDDTDYSLSAGTSIDRFLPDLGLSLPVSARYHTSRSLPTLESKSDIVLEPDERKDQARTSVDDSYKISVSRRKKSSHALLRLTIDAMSASASYTRRRASSPEVADTSSGYSGSFAYKFTPWWDSNIRVYRGYQISYLPKSVAVNVNGTTRQVKKINKREGVKTEDKYSRDIKGVFDASFQPFSGPLIQTNYGIKMTRDLDQNKNVPIPSSIGLGRELTRNQRAGVKITPTFGKWMRPTLSYDVSYDENSDPKVRSASDPAGVRRASMTSSSRVDLYLTVGSLFTEPAKPGDTTGISTSRLLLSKIPDLEVSYVLDRNAKYNKLLGRPGLKFQLGLDPRADEDLIYTSSSGAAQRTDELIRRNRLDLSTDFTPVSVISLDSRYKYDKSTKAYAGSKTYNEDVTWPDVTGNISSIASLSFLQGVMKSSAVVLGYKGSRSVRGVGESTKTSETRRSEWLPLVGWDATWNNGVRTTFNITRSSSETENLQGTRSLQRTEHTAFNISVRHSFSAPQGMYIPLAGRTLKFKSNLTLSADFNYEATLTTTPTSNNRVDKDLRKFGIVPKASYSFSKNITGSANARFEQSSDRKLGQTWRTIGISASVLIRF